MSNIKEDLRKVKAFAFDVDGVFSEINIILHPGGELMRTMNIRDGFATQLAIKKGYPLAIITGGNTNSVKIRFEKLGIRDIFMESSDKLVNFREFTRKYKLSPKEVLYMGDDLPDYEVMSQVGFPACPSDAVEEIQSISKYISDKPGGHGCVRDILEQVLRIHGKWMDQDSLSW